MKRETYKLSKDQFISDIEPFASAGIPNNSILHKVLTGCGATTLEIKYSNRNSIIIVPNVPVIESKVEEHNSKHPKHQHILGVHKTVDVYKIEDYLNSEATYKKILTTPEGFMNKVLFAFENDIETMKKDYFLLIDECERIVTDVSYRGAIAAPINWFFKFDNKALVSATTLPFSHPGFAIFDHYAIEPTYDYKKATDVVLTNNVIESLQKHLASLKDDKPAFIFVNSTDTIAAIINILDIKSDSHVYCGEKSVARLVGKKIKHAYNKLDIGGLAKYNFLTSRFFSAFDIRLDYKPDVLMVTDVFTAAHSILDPHTEIIQAAGRFRNGINSLTHIANFNPSLESKTATEALQYLNGCFDTYNSVVKLFGNAKDEGSRDTLAFFVKNSPIAKYYDDNVLNQFMVDNYVYEERVKGYYQKPENLQAAYNEVEKHFNTTFINEEYLLSDEDRNRLDSQTRVREQQWETLRQIDKLSHKPGVFTLHYSYQLLSNLRSLYPWLTEAYDLLGMEGLKKTGLSAAKINPAKARAKEIKELKKLAPFIHNEFEEFTTPYDSDLKDSMPKLCTQAKVELKPTQSLILKFFEGDRTTKGGIHVHNLRSKIDLDTLTPFD